MNGYIYFSAGKIETIAKKVIFYQSCNPFAVLENIYSCLYSF